MGEIVTLIGKISCRRQMTMSITPMEIHLVPYFQILFQILLGSGSIFTDLIGFLENNVDGFSNYDSDPSLETLLQTGSLDEIRNELDDTQLLLQQLQTKNKDVLEDLNLTNGLSEETYL